LRVRVVWQHAFDDVLPDDVTGLPNPEVDAVPAADSEGCNWARRRLQMGPRIDDVMKEVLKLQRQITKLAKQVGGCTQHNREQPGRLPPADASTATFGSRMTQTRR